jgi:hypothetical protein
VGKCRYKGSSWQLIAGSRTEEGGLPYTAGGWRKIEGSRNVLIENNDHSVILSGYLVPDNTEFYIADFTMTIK